MTDQPTTEVKATADVAEALPSWAVPMANAMTEHIVHDATKITATEGEHYKEYAKVVVRDEIDRVMRERQTAEDIRANHRNVNRLITLIAAILIGLVVTWTLPHLGHLGMVLAPYSFVITVLFDSCLTIYALVRHY